MFRLTDDATEQRVDIEFNGQHFKVPPGISVAAAVLLIHSGATRKTAISRSPRAPYCMMGVCYECLLEIDGQPNQQACMRFISAGMSIKTQIGAGVPPK